MIIDLRYHVVSLVAVFLALGLGIVIGINLGKTANLHFENQLAQLENTYEKIREDQKLLQSSIQAKENEIEIAKQFQKAILPNLINSRLVGKRIAIIRTNDSVGFKYSKQLASLLRQAGAEVTSITSITTPPDLRDPKLKENLIKGLKLRPGSDRYLALQINQIIVSSIVEGQNSNSLNFLQSKRQLELWGDYNRGYLDTLIFFGGGTEPPKNHQQTIDWPLLDAARRTGVKLIGVETSFATDSYMRLYQTKCRGTVDNIDTSAGEATLVYLLASGQRGYYGIKDSARALIPDFHLNY